MPIEVRHMAPLLQVFDMPTSIEFYCAVLGFEVVMSDGKTLPNVDWVMLELNGVQIMLNTAYEAPARPAKADAAHIAAHRDTGLFFACPDVDAAYRHLAAKGVNVKEPKVAPYGMKQLYVDDPDGYVLCFQWKAE
jgi:catechol 2,3-dioxygenase-like lactoylglutathione lyase family enzyme